ncbi:MAG: mechanosensitive ion channel family protein [Bacteroidales bacterium]|nr:mechanosensitive ion channel family protein [Bacteroidales bacterium]
MKFIYIAIAALAVLMFLKIVGAILIKARQKYPYLKKVQKAFPLFGIALWIAFAFWVVRILFKDDTLYDSINIGLVAIIVILVSWIVFRDIVAGAVFRMQNDVNNGDFIKVGELSGHIKSIGLTHLDMISDKGQIVKIPNLRLSKELISGLSSPEGIEEFTIHLSVNKSFGKPEIEEKINCEIANSPWCNFKNPPVIKFQGEEAGVYHYDVMVFTLNPQHFNLVEKMLQDKFGSKPDASA